MVRKQLARLRRRERLLRLGWGLARWLALALAAMTLACFLDWLVDRRQDTPMGLRVALLLGQIVLWTWGGYRLLVQPMFRRMKDDDLALWVESKAPAFEHRLISAVQLTRPGAATRGMSPVLIAGVAEQAEAAAARLDFRAFLDRERLRRSAWLAGGMLLFGLLVVSTASDLVPALVARQFLADRSIPRSVTIAAVGPEVWPAGEEVELRFRAAGPGLTGEMLENLQGEVRVEPVGRRPETHTLSFETVDADGHVIFVARNIYSAADFTYRAWLKDGRTREDSLVRFEARPVVNRQDAWVRLPAYAGLRPDGEPFEQYQPRGEIAGLAGVTARIQARTQKPVGEARLEILGRPADELLTSFLGTGLSAPNTPLATPGERMTSAAVAAARKQLPGFTPTVGPELLLRLGVSKPQAMNSKPEAVLVRVGEDHQTIEGVFDLRPGETGYRIRVKDRHGFANLDPPRRGIRVVGDEPPHVALMPERFAAPGESLLAEDAEVEGLPVPLGEGGQALGSVRIAYSCRDAFGLDRARLRYRINEGPWHYLPLQEIRGSDEAGPFDPRQGVFEKTGPRDQIEFHAVPSSDPDQTPGRLEGGGRFDFLVRAIPNLKLGDVFEFAVEVFDRNPDPARKPGESEVRRKEVVSEEEFIARVLQTLQQEARIRQLEQKQRGVFDRPARN